jgi:hypothetical protein
MKQVFVSYSRNNLEIVTQLIQDLQACGIDTWYDQSLTGGQRWWDNILANIRQRDFFIFALSPEAMDSQACKCELSYVARLNKTILPVLISDGINMNLLSPPLSEIQITDYRRGNKEAVMAIVKSIYTAPPAPPLPDPLPPSPPVPISYLNNLKDRIESTEPLDSQNQITILFELEEDLRKGRSPAEIRDLLLLMKRRDDLLAKISVKIDAALEKIESAPPVQRRPNPVHTLPEEPRVYEKKTTAADLCTTEPETARVSQGNSKNARHYVSRQDNLPRLISEVKSWLDSQGFDSQQMNTENESLLLQIKKRGGWRDFVGMATSLNIVFNQSDDTLTVEIGAGKWIDKAAVGTVSLFILWPLAITAGMGAWEQMKLPQKIFDFIGNRLSYR